MNQGGRDREGNRAKAYQLTTHSATTPPTHTTSAPWAHIPGALASPPLAFSPQGPSSRPRGGIHEVLRKLGNSPERRSSIGGPNGHRKPFHELLEQGSLRTPTPPTAALAEMVEDRLRPLTPSTSGFCNHGGKFHTAARDTVPAG